MLRAANRTVVNSTSLEGRRPVTIDGAFHGEGILPQDVCVDLCRTDIFVSKEFLNGADICSVRQEMRGKGMSKGVATGMLGDFQLPNCGVDGFLEIRSVEVVAAPDAAPRVDRRLCRGVDKLPTPFPVSLRVLAGQCVRQDDATIAFLHGPLVFSADMEQVLLQWSDKNFRQERDAIFITFALAHGHLQAIKVQVFHAKSQAFHEPQPAAIEL